MTAGQVYNFYLPVADIVASDANFIKYFPANPPITNLHFHTTESRDGLGPGLSIKITAPTGETYIGEDLHNGNTTFDINSLKSPNIGQAVRIYRNDLLPKGIGPLKSLV